MRKNNNPRRRPGRPVEQGPLHRDSWRSKAEDVVDRLNALRDRWVADKAWRQEWAAMVRRVDVLTAHWPATLADATGEDIGILDWAEGPRTLSPRPTDDGLYRLGLTLEEWRAQQPNHPATFRPMLQALADAMATEPTVNALAEAVQPPAPVKLPRKPKSSTAAREQWLRARAQYTRMRISVRRGHQRREDIADRITRAITTFKLSWWRAWIAVLIEANGVRTNAVAGFEKLRHETLTNLLALRTR